MGTLATIGCQKIKIKQDVRVGLLSTGNELVRFDMADVPAGKIRDSNKIMLKTLLATLSCQIVNLGSVCDSGVEIDNKF